jgi:hypothetical protein
MKQLLEKDSVRFQMEDKGQVAQFNTVSAAPVRHVSRAVFIGATLEMDTGFQES